VTVEEWRDFAQRAYDRLRGPDTAILKDGQKCSPS
jgi:hypothetical protein